MKPGKSAIASIGMTPATDSQSADRGYPFIIVGFGDPTQLKLGQKRIWDTTGKFGGPHDLFLDGALASAAVNGDGCLFGGNHLSDISDVTWKALRTDTKVNDHDKGGLTALSKIAIKADASATPAQEQLYFIGGTWNDDGDANPQNSEVGCTGGTLTTLAIGG